MPDITFGLGVNSHPKLLTNFLDFLGDASLVGATATELTYLRTGAIDVFYVMTGTGFTTAGGAPPPRARSPGSRSAFPEPSNSP